MKTLKIKNNNLFNIIHIMLSFCLTFIIINIGLKDFFKGSLIMGLLFLILLYLFISQKFYDIYFWSYQSINEWFNLRLLNKKIEKAIKFSFIISSAFCFVGLMVILITTGYFISQYENTHNIKYYSLADNMILPYTPLIVCLSIILFIVVNFILLVTKNTAWSEAHWRPADELVWK